MCNTDAKLYLALITAFVLLFGRGSVACGFLEQHRKDGDGGDEGKVTRTLGLR